MAKVRRKNEVVAESQPGNNRAMWLGGVLVVLILAVIAIAMLGRGTGSGAAVDPGEYEGIPTQGLFVGAEDAPVVVREFIDFKCPHCADASERIVPQVIEDYVREGQVRMEFIPVAFNDQSLPGAEAAHCAVDQGLFLPYHDLLFANQRNTYNITNLTNWATQVGMDEQAFRACITAGKYRQQVEQNLAEFRRVGAASTPTFYVNDTPVVGAVPYEELQAAIDAALGQ